MCSLYPLLCSSWNLFLSSISWTRWNTADLTLSNQSIMLHNQIWYWNQINVPIPSQESQRSCICVLWGINFASYYKFSIGFLYQVRKVSTVAMYVWVVGCQFWFFLQFWYWILELFRQCVMFWFNIWFDCVYIVGLAVWWW